MERKNKIFRNALLGIFLINTIALFPSFSFSLSQDFSPLKESKAYQQFVLRPVSDFSKLAYLIDRFMDSDLEIVYDGHYYKAPFAARVARWFLARNYKKQTPEEWIMQWCNASVPEGNLIWVKLPNGKFRLSREILLDELHALNRTISQESETKTSNLAVAAMAPLVVKTSPASSLGSPSRSN